MSAWLVALCGFIYLYVCIEQFIKHDYWMSLLYFGYAVANIGAVMIVIKGVKA